MHKWWQTTIIWFLLAEILQLIKEYEVILQLITEIIKFSILNLKQFEKKS